MAYILATNGCGTALFLNGSAGGITFRPILFLLFSSLVSLSMFPHLLQCAMSRGGTLTRFCLRHTIQLLVQTSSLRQYRQLNGLEPNTHLFHRRLQCFAKMRSNLLHFEVRCSRQMSWCKAEDNNIPFQLCHDKVLDRSLAVELSEYIGHSLACSPVCVSLRFSSVCCISILPLRLALRLPFFGLFARLRGVHVIPNLLGTCPSASSPFDPRHCCRGSNMFLLASCHLTAPKNPPVHMYRGPS